MPMIFSLEAESSVNKTIDLKNNQKTTPNIPFKFTSHRQEVTSILTFYNLLVRLAANPNACLLKGELVKNLFNESRAGTTDASLPTQWVCLDLDGYQGAQSADEFLMQIGISDVSYVFQHSSSSGIKPGLNGHIFMILEHPVPPRVLKCWLRHLNYTVEPLVNELSLTRTLMSLRHRLDITTCQNDKLIFTALPTIKNGKDPITERIELVTKSISRLPVPTPEADKELQLHANKIVNLLRDRAGHAKKRFRSLVEYKGVEVMPSPTVATITGEKTERGYTYLNLNGGDSWGYYHLEDNAEILFNFKGEPAYKMKDILPDYYAIKAGPENTSGFLHLGFRDLISGCLFIGTYDAVTYELSLHASPTESAVRAYLEQNNTFIGDIIPTWSVVWDPHSDPGVDIQLCTVNVFKPSEFANKTYEPPSKAHPLKAPATIQSLVRHVVGDDEDSYHHMLHWISAIVQTKNKTGLAWLLHGVQGTGKNLLVNEVLTPMLGKDNVFIGNMDLMLQDFNGFIARKFLIFIDEADTDGLTRADKNRVERRIKELITNADLSVRRMRANHVMEVNYANIMFGSNKTIPLTIAEDDRRVNVAEFQAAQLVTGEFEKYRAALKSELDEFYRFCKYFPYDKRKATKPFENAARQRMMDRSLDSHTLLKKAILHGDIKTIIDQMPSPRLSNVKLMTTVKSSRAVAYDSVRQFIMEILRTSKTRKNVSREDMQALWLWCVEYETSPTKFSMFMTKLGIKIEPVKVSNKLIRGTRVDKWDITEFEAEKLLRMFENDDL